MKYFILITMLLSSVIANVVFVILVRSLNSQLREEKVVFVPLDTLDEETLWDVVQDWRMSVNLKPYSKDEALCAIARMRLPEVKKDFSHAGFTEKKILKYKILGENLARGFLDERETLQAWLASASHAANLKFNFTHSCIETDETYAVQIFGGY